MRMLIAGVLMLTPRWHFINFYIVGHRFYEFSVFERALDIDYKSHNLWLKYAEVSYKTRWHDAPSHFAFSPRVILSLHAIFTDGNA